jgi:hypothetical protein
MARPAAKKATTAKTSPAPPPPGGPTQASFLWRDCVVRLQSDEPRLIARIARHLGLAARNEVALHTTMQGPIITVSAEAQGFRINSSDWTAEASHPDQVCFLILEALGQAFVASFSGIVFHAGAFIAEAGAVVFYGAPGAGKTNLALAAWRRGLSVISDERMVLSPELSAVSPFPKCLKLRCAEDAKLDTILHGINPDDCLIATVGKERRLILARSLPGFAPYESFTPIHTLVELERAERGVTLAPLEPSGALDTALLNLVSADFNPTAAVRLIKQQADRKRLFRLRSALTEIDKALDLLLKL